MKALIMSGGDAPSRELSRKEAQECDYIIGVDKGIEYLYRYDITPNVLVGDFDSVNDDILKEMLKKHSEVVKLPVEKDFTDTQIALNKCLELRIDNITFLACLGGRLDHSLANIALLHQCLLKGKKACIKDDRNTIFMTDRSISIKGKKGNYFSLLPFGGPVKGLTISDSKYVLKDYDLSPSDNITISNEFLEKDAVVSFMEGTLLVALCSD